MDDEKKPKKRLSAETKADILGVLIIIMCWVFIYINDITVKSKGIEVFLMICAWVVAVFSKSFVEYWKGRFKD